MPTPAYMTIEGERQSNITAGAFTEDSVSNVYQEGHEDEVLFEAMDHTVTIPRDPQSAQPSGQRVRKPVIIGLIIALCLFAIQGCSRDTGEEKHLLITGSSTMAPLVSEIAERFGSRRPEVQVDVQAGGSGKGLADARSGAADIGMVSRALTAAEGDLTAYPIALDGVGLIVHASNPLSGLDRADVRAIYTGEVENWKELGGPDLPIIVVHKAAGRATLKVFLDHFELENPRVQPDVVVGHNEQAIKTVAGAPGAIGYVSIGTAEADEAAGLAIRRLPLGGVPASRENVMSGAYPMSRPLNLVVNDTPSPLALDFIRFARTESVYDTVRKQLFAPISH